MDKNYSSSALTEFLAFVRELLPRDKFYSFCLMMRFPVATVSLMDEVFTYLEKIFDGRNPVYQYQFNNSDDELDWQEYRSKAIKWMDWWQTKGLEAMRAAFNSIMIVDLPTEQKDRLPSPYLSLVGLSRVYDMEIAGEDVLEWIMFWEDDEHFLVFDDERYRRFKVEKGDLSKLPMPEIEETHDLGYCPARFFWSTPISYDEPLVKKSPVTNYLGALDHLLFFWVANEDLNTYARYPIYSGFAPDCEYEDEERGWECDDGFLRSRDGSYLMNGDRLQECPKCASKRLNGPGSYIEFDPPGLDNDGADLRNPVQVTTIDRTSLDYNVEDIDRRKLEVFSAITGYQGGMVKDQAVNEKQVTAVFESLEASLKEPQRNIELAMTWAADTICLLRYGANYMGSSISLGTEHYILSSGELLEAYQEIASKGNVGAMVLDALEDRYYDTEYRYNEEMRARQQIMCDLDPFRHLSLSNVQGMYAANQIEYTDFMLKTNMSTLIRRFERENMDIVEFGANVEYQTKLEAIRAALLSYIEESQPEVVTVPPVEVNQ